MLLDREPQPTNEKIANSIAHWNSYVSGENSSSRMQRSSTDLIGVSLTPDMWPVLSTVQQLTTQEKSRALTHAICGLYTLPLPKNFDVSAGHKQQLTPLDELTRNLSVAIFRSTYPEIAIPRRYIPSEWNLVLRQVGDWVKHNPEQQYIELTNGLRLRPTQLLLFALHKDLFLHLRNEGINIVGPMYQRSMIAIVPSHTGEQVSAKRELPAENHYAFLVESGFLPQGKLASELTTLLVNEDPVVWDFMEALITSLPHVNKISLRNNFWKLFLNDHHMAKSFYKKGYRARVISSSDAEGMCGLVVDKTTDKGAHVLFGLLSLTHNFSLDSFSTMHLRHDMASEVIQSHPCDIPERSRPSLLLITTQDETAHYVGDPHDFLATLTHYTEYPKKEYGVLQEQYLSNIFKTRFVEYVEEQMQRESIQLAEYICQELYEAGDSNRRQRSSLNFSILPTENHHCHCDSDEVYHWMQDREYFNAG